MFNEVDEITFDNNSKLNMEKQQVPSDVQTDINTIVNKEQASLIGNETNLSNCLNILYYYIVCYIFLYTLVYSYDMNQLIMNKISYK